METRRVACDNCGAPLEVPNALRAAQDRHLARRKKLKRQIQALQEQKVEV